MQLLDRVEGWTQACPAWDEEAAGGAQAFADLDHRSFSRNQTYFS